MDKKMNNKMMKRAHRKALMNLGIYNIHKEKVIKSKKGYNRKNKHKKNNI